MKMHVDNDLALNFLDPPFTLVNTNHTNVDRKITKYILMVSFFTIAGSFDLCHYFFDKPESNRHVLNGFNDCALISLSTKDLYLMTSITSFITAGISMRKLYTLRKEFVIDALHITGIVSFILFQMTASGFFCFRR